MRMKCGRWARRGRLMLAAAMLAACGGGEAGDGAGGAGRGASAVGGSGGEGVGLTPGGAEGVLPVEPRHFDPGAIAVGDTFLNLRVTARDVHRAMDDSVWVGRVRFAGLITVTGEFRRHSDWPEPEALCFNVGTRSSIQRIPDFAPDSWTSPNAITWFCFTNPGQVQAALGDGARPVRATIVVDDYLVVREFSDVFDTARLVEVVAVAGPPGGG
jgi:hypothetical protein